MKISNCILTILLFITLFDVDLKARDRIKIIELNPEYTTIPDFSFFIQDVMDCREDTSNIGIYKKLDSNRRIICKLKGGVKKCLQNYLQFSIPRTSGEPVSIKISEFKTGNIEEPHNGITFLTIEYYVIDSGVLKKDYVTSVVDDKFGKGIAQLHSAIIKNAIHKSLTLYHLYRLSRSNNNIQSENRSSDIVSSENKNTGLYKDFQEFLSNSPSINVNFDIKKRSKASQLMVGGSDYNIMIDSTLYDRDLSDLVWGICDGKNVYISSRNYQMNYGFFMLNKIKENYSIFEGNIMPSQDQRLTGAIIGGAIGGAIAGAPRRSKLILDMKTGSIMPLYYEGLENLYKNKPDLYNTFKNVPREQVETNLELWLDMYYKR